MDLPGTFELVDIRPSDHFADYSLPASVNVDVAELLDNPAYLTGAGPIIIVDRDGSLAMMLAGILSQKTQRSVKALYGGLEAYWSETMAGGFTQPSVAVSTSAPPVPAHPAPAAPPSATPPVPSQQQPKPPAKKSAGC
jgi:hydroxyacylglutathione hydrolase